MKLRKFPLFLLSLMAFGFYSCIDSDQTNDAIFERDLEAIDDYIAQSSIVNVKEFQDARGFTVIWQEVSGSGIPVVVGDTISTDYVGKLLTDEVFDTSVDSVARQNNIFNPERLYIPLRFPTGRGLVISGFEWGLLLLEQGDKATILMPSELGYGGNPPGGIPLDAPLIFEVNMIEIKEGFRQ